MAITPNAAESPITIDRQPPTAEHGPSTTAPVLESLALLDSFNHRRVVPADSPPPGSYLELSDGDAAWLLPLEREITRVGRGLAVHVHFDDDRVSRRHALIATGAGRARILDDRSANGTFVNGRRVEQAPLCDGDVVRLGPVVMRYREVPVRGPRSD